MTGPSERAVEVVRAHVRRAFGDSHDAADAVMEAVAATHDPVLGPDRSVCVRDALTAVDQALCENESNPSVDVGDRVRELLGVPYE